MTRTTASWLLVALLAATTASLGCPTPQPKPAKPVYPPASQPSSQPAGRKVALQLYTMSMCPYAGEVEQALEQLVATMGDRLELKLDYILEDKAGELTSLHGPQEVAGNIVELCAMSQQPDPRRYLAFINCQNLAPRAIPSRWEACAKKLGIDLVAMRRCFGGRQGANLLVASMKRAAAAKANASPTLLIDGARHVGPRDKSGLLRAICARLTDSAPEACASLPAEVPMEALVLSDKRCKECARLLPLVEHNLRARFFPKLKLKQLDYADAAGKALYQRLKLTGLPAVLLPRAAEKAERFSAMAGFIELRQEYWRLTLPAHFDPTAEICDNGKDDTGNGKTDCADPSCKQVLGCRAEQKGRLAIFTMAHCPFCHQALLAMDEVFKRLGSRRVRFDLRYVADRAASGGFKALHGKAEVDENIRQLCAKKHYPRNRRYLKYVVCRAGDRGDAWQPCALSSKITPAVIDRCVKSGEGAKLLGADIDSASALRVNATPTWLVNNKHFFKGVTADAIVAGFCRHNKQVPACLQVSTSK